MYSMNYKKACAILNLDRHEVNVKNVKKKYHMLALRYHPDRNKDVHADRDFKQINEAYQYLLNNNNDDANILQKMRESLNMEFFLAIFKLYTALYILMEKRAIYWFSQGALKKRRQNSNNNNPNFKEDMQSFFMYDQQQDHDDENECEYENDHHECEKEADQEEDQETEELDETENIMVLRPFLDDVLVESVFKYTRFGNKLLIPLWHHEIEYDISGCFVVQIIPKLPSKNYWIDNDNNLHQIIEYQISELWDCVLHEKYVEVFFGRKRLLFYPHHLQMKKKQLWKWEKVGIPKINHHNVYDVSLRADIILHIHIC